MTSKKEEENYESDADGDSEGDLDDDEAPKRRRPRVECIMGDRSAEELRNHHPQRITADFKWAARTVTLTSDFDAGNMVRAEQADCPNHFNIWMSSDSMPYYKYTGFRAWFYFAIRGVERGKNVHFHIRNMSFQRSLYASGLRPFFRVGREGKFRRIPGKLTWGNGEDGFQVNFTHQMTAKDPEALTYFSFVEPWGYEDTVEYFSAWQDKIKSSPRMSDEVYFHRELLGYSLERRYMELITITGKNDNSMEREEKVEGQGMFPEFADDSEEAKIFSRDRCHKFNNKKVVFFCARVHPGEVQASHVLNGIVDFILSKSQQASIILENYVIKIIPLVNPDGVARGYYRLDTHNHNLNRFYLNPCPDQQPTVYQVKKAIVAQHRLGNLKLYIDLHGHASKKGCFIFGNNLKGEQQADNMLFAKLISLNSLNFDFQECSFSEKLMTAKDGGSGLSREGSGRVGIHKATGMVHSYTLECHYQTGRRLNTLTAKYNADQMCVEAEDALTDRNSKFYRDQRTPNYTVEIFEDVGRAVCIALLEWIEKNPTSRIPTSHYKNLASIRNELIVHNCLLPYDILKDLRKEVAKERELMKARTQKLQAQIQSKRLADEKRAAKQKDREEREAKNEALEKLKGEQKDQHKRQNSKKPKVTRKSSNADLKEEGPPNLKSIKNNMQVLASKSPSDRFFAKIGSDILSPAMKKLKNGNLRNQLAKQSTQSDGLQSKEADPAKQASNNSPERPGEDAEVPAVEAKERRPEPQSRTDSRQQAPKVPTILNEKVTKSAKSASRKKFPKKLFQNMYRTDKDGASQASHGSHKGHMNRQRSNLSCNDKDNGPVKERFISSEQRATSNEPEPHQRSAFNDETNCSSSQNGLSLFQHFAQMRSAKHGTSPNPQSQKISIEFLRKLGIPLPKDGEMIIIQHNDQLHCIDRRRPEDRKEKVIVNLSQQQNPPSQLVPQTIQGQLNNPKQMPAFIGGSQFGLSYAGTEDQQKLGLLQNDGAIEKSNIQSSQDRAMHNLAKMNKLKQRALENAAQGGAQPAKEQGIEGQGFAQLAGLRGNPKNGTVKEVGGTTPHQLLQKGAATFLVQQNSTRDRTSWRDKQLLPEILDQHQENSGHFRSTHQVFPREIQPLIRKLQKAQMMRNARFAPKPGHPPHRTNTSSSNSRPHESGTQPEFSKMDLADGQRDDAPSRKVSNSVETAAASKDENVQFLNLLEQKSKIIEQFSKTDKAGKPLPFHYDMSASQAMALKPLRATGQLNKSSAEDLAFALKSAYPQNTLFQRKIREAHNQRPCHEFSQFVNQHVSPDGTEVVPQIMAQNYQRMMKSKKNVAPGSTNMPAPNAKNAEYTQQLQLLQSIDAAKLEHQTVEAMGQKPTHVFQHRRQRELNKRARQRAEISPDPLQGDSKSSTLVPQAHAQRRSSRPSLHLTGHVQAPGPEQTYENDKPMAISHYSKQSSYNNFMVQGVSAESSAPPGSVTHPLLRAVLKSNN